MADNEIAILVMKAAADLRKAASLDKARRNELQSLAEYLESIIYEKELDDEPAYVEPEAVAISLEDEIRSMITPFRVRLTR